MTLRVDLPVVLSYSGGTSKVILYYIDRGILPRPENFAVAFADTGFEHEWTYEEIGLVAEECRRLGITLLNCAQEIGLETHVLDAIETGASRIEQPPFWIAKGRGRGRAPSRCTRYFKIAPMRRAISSWLETIGQPKRVVKWLVYGADEAHRAGKSIATQDVAWETLDFPAIRLGYSRAKMKYDLEQWTGYAPRYSACIACPWLDPARFAMTSDADKKRLYAFDEAIRDLDQFGLTDGPAYVTDRLIPVRQLIERGDPQPQIPGLEPYCSGGACFL